jgi:hypothetical protein
VTSDESRLRGQIEALAATISAREPWEEVYRRAVKQLRQEIVSMIEKRQGGAARPPQKLWPHEDLADTRFLEKGGKTPSLVEFIDEIGARNDKEVAACCIVYLVKRVSPVSFSHVIAAFKRLGIPDFEPRSLQRTLYDLAARRGGFKLKHPQNGARLELTPAGLDYVEEIRKKYARGNE